MFVDETCETNYVAAEARNVCEQTIEPIEVGVNYLYEVTNIKHGKESARTYYAPIPYSKEDITTCQGKYDKSYIDNYLDFREGLAGYFADCNDDTFSRHRYRATSHFEGNTDCHNCAAQKLNNRFWKQSVTYDRRS